PVDDLGKAFNIGDPSTYAQFQCKQLEALYASLAADGKEIGTDSIRYFVGLYTGLPVVRGENTYLPKTAVDILKSTATLTEEQINTLEEFSVDLSQVTEADTTVETSTTAEAYATAAVIEAPAESASTEDASTDKTVKGSTTFKNLLDWGVTKEDIELILGEKMPDPDKIIKDYATSKEIEFSTLKEPLQTLADKTK
ncbi:MAG: hypothetical protein HGA22_06640, partial [Clostridiales bacterium]|nr:hypothetical protein [Clostridiales bacterium]